MKRVLLVLLCIAIINVGLMTSSSASALVEKENFEKYFEGFTVSTFVMYDEANERYVVYNEPQSIKRLSPCSTFKIYNSLAGLETGVLDQEDISTLVQWNGTQYPLTSWNHDQTLASATKDSVVWYFQELASQIGTKRMQSYLDKIGYGNRDISDGSTFWLQSSLQISAREQVDMLQRLYSGKLPVSLKNVEIVKKNITLSEDNGVRLMGKTGSQIQIGTWIVSNKLGWFVGCVEKQGNRYFFATNIQALDGATGGKAREITKSILKDLQIL